MDRLLKKLDQAIDELSKMDEGIFTLEIFKSVKSVIDLHKSKKSEFYSEDVCQVCCDPRRVGYVEPYPCPTIKAIQNELELNYL